MKKISLLIHIIPLVILSSCESWFDISPKSELKANDLFENSQGFRDALIGCYGSMATQDLYGGQLTMTYLDVLAQYYSTAGTTLNKFEYAFAYNYTEAKEESRKDAIWKNGYNVIANLNSLLGRIDEKKDIFAIGEYELFKGEALGLRAYIHLDLLRLFAASPAMENGSTRRAIPYVDKYTNELFECLTTEKVLNRIVDDLEEARILLEKVDPYGPKHADYDLENLTDVWKGREYRMNYYAATALLARTLLYRNAAGDKATAYNYATEVISSGLFPLISGSDLSSQDRNGFTQENIFSLEYNGLKDEIADTYFYTSNTSSNFLAINRSTLNKIFPSSLDMDYRWQWWIENSGSYNLIAKYNYSKRIPLLKIGEMFLVATEAASTLDEANDYFSQLQYHRGLPETELTAENLQEMLLAEYAKEFLGEGQLFYAYKRMAMQKKPILQTALSDYESVYILPLPTENTYFINE
ncbi:MAG: RagB/SusD family nutrient uptake outer membrane protein [Bacteroides sp.]|nr:RagB/SusD family nutrient uptake outer membrane protein [Bacteroides sp.]